MVAGNGNDVGEDDGREGAGFDYGAAKDMLEGIFEWDQDKKKVLGEVEAACKSFGHEENSRDIKHRLMACLRKRGVDAGLCKSQREKTGRFPAGEYQYVDVNLDGVRYIVELTLDGQFQIARPTDQLDSLLELFPPIFVGTFEELKEVVRLLSAAIRQSLRSRGLAVPPRRKSGNMKAKWFSSYNRSTISNSKPKCMNGEEQLISGFMAPWFVPSRSSLQEGFGQA